MQAGINLQENNQSGRMKESRQYILQSTPQITTTLLIWQSST